MVKLTMEEMRGQFANKMMLRPIRPKPLMPTRIDKAILLERVVKSEHNAATQRVAFLTSRENIPCNT